MGKKIAVIGGGNMGGALIEGWLLSGKIPPNSLVVADAADASRRRFEASGLTTFADNKTAVKDADLVVVAVKPWLVGPVAEDVAKLLKNNALLISVAAGVPLAELQKLFGTDRACFRVIPNIAAALGESTTFVSTEDQQNTNTQTVLDLFRLVGEAVLIPEKLLDAGTIVGSCGTAFALRYLRAAMEAGIQMGLSASLARTVVAQTMKGAAELMLRSDIHPEAAIDRVTTPGGTTIVGLNALELNGFSSAVVEGHLAVHRHKKA